MKIAITTAAIVAMVLTAGVALATDAVCGDVNNDSEVKTSDALLVLRKSVNQSITLDCSAYEDHFSACETSLAGANASLSSCNSDLSTTNANLTTCSANLVACQEDLATCAGGTCGNGTLESGEDCDVGTLDSEPCATLGFAGGTLACAPGCTFDTSDCYTTRFDASGATIIDHQTGLEWEKKDSATGSGVFIPCPWSGDLSCENPHDVDNVYKSLPEEGLMEFLSRLNDASAGCYAGHCDWRLPTIWELSDLPSPLPAALQPDSSSFQPGPYPSYYWSASAAADPPLHVWCLDTISGEAATRPYAENWFARAVRSGS